MQYSYKFFSRIFFPLLGIGVSGDRIPAPSIGYLGCPSKFVRSKLFKLGKTLPSSFVIMESYHLIYYTIHSCSYIMPFYIYFTFILPLNSTGLFRSHSTPKGVLHLFKVAFILWRSTDLGYLKLLAFLNGSVNIHRCIAR